MRTIQVDSQILNSISACPRKTKYGFIDNLELPEKPEALEKGSLIHSMLEVRDSVANPHLINEKSDTIISLREKMPDCFNMDPVEAALAAAPMFASSMVLDPDIYDETVYQFKEYCEYRKNDNWKVLAVEQVGTKLMYEDEELRILYAMKIDKVAENGRIVAPWDYKTSRRRQDPNALSNQFMGYAWGLGLNTVVVEKIGFQKSLKPHERFLRDLLTYSDAQLEEWRLNSVFWIKQLLHHLDTNTWPFNLTSCDKYSGCTYKSICEADPEGREWTITRNYRVRKAWDVAEILAAKNE